MQGNFAAILQGGTLTALLFVASYTDIKKREIPDTVSLLIALTALLRFSPLNLLGILIALPLLVAALCKDGSFGGGDIKLTAAVGLVLGFTNGLIAMLLAFIAELAFYFCYFIIQKLCKRQVVKSLPFAPFLTVGVLTVNILTGGLLWVF